MTFLDLLNQANTGYPDGFLARYYHAGSGEPVANSGDTLAQFIVTDLRETFDPGGTDENQLEEAARVLERARADLASTISAIEVIRGSAGLGKP